MKTRDGDDGGGELRGLRSRMGIIGIHTRQFSYEWQAKDLRDTENGRVRKRLNKKDLESRNCGSKGIAIAGEERT